MLYDPNWKSPEAPVEIPGTKKKKVKAKSKRKTWRTLMLDAANILKKQGWVKGQLHVSGQGFCTMGALQRADAGSIKKMRNGNYRPSQAATAAISKLEASLSGSSIVVWNDLQVQNVDTVIRKLREVAK